MDRSEAEALSLQIHATTGLDPRIEPSGDEDDWDVVVEVPPTGGALREEMRAGTPEDWDWLWSAYEARRLGTS